ncbi:hypothetical protein EXW94_25865 [Enterobacter sp. JMULE2]|uniref:hypothetical protein n=1 Tax=Enterobacter sp. JMULE2 TaxID=2518340 RepID=UPI0015758E8F|nr:hypothetical protein [Enterobacter sp. JMULE2]NTZ41029.1 hypothetical protein [Enterobacter sp. JMULE2]
MLKKWLTLLPAMFLSGCGYHFQTEMEAYDLVPRPVGHKQIEIIAPDDSIQSRVFENELATGLTKKGFVISSGQSDYVLSFTYSRPVENKQYSTEPVTGVIGYVMTKKKQHSDKKRESNTEYEYEPVEGVVGTETYSRLHYVRQFSVSMRVGTPAGKEVLSVIMKSNAPVPSDNAAYTAMINALIDKMDTPLRSGFYSTVIPWN